MFDAAWGWVDPETRQQPVQTNALFDLASITKLFTTTAFLSLVSAGQVRLDDPLAQIIPEFSASGPRPLDAGQDPHTRAMFPIPAESRGQTADPGRVTFRQLLTHTSALAPWRAVFQVSGPAPKPPGQPDRLSRQERWSQAISALCAYPFVGQPGDHLRYSDLGLILLGEALSRLAGSPLDVAVRQRVLAPLKLPSLVYNPLRNGYKQVDVIPTEFDNDWRGRRCWGEVHDENACGLGGVAGHAGLFGNALDVARFGQAWLDYDNCLDIAEDIMRLATQGHAASDSQRRGLGWMLTSLQNSPAGDLFSREAYGHTGFTGTSLWVDPQRQLVIACLTNRVYPGRHKPGIHTFRRKLHDLFGDAIH